MDSISRHNIRQAIDLLRIPDKKEEIGGDKGKETWRGKPPIPILAGAKAYSGYLGELDEAGDLDDKELLMAFAEQVFGYIKQFSPELMPEIKDKYFKG